MVEENKDLIKRDLSIIKRLHQKTDYTQSSHIEVIYNYAVSKELLKTNLGQKYLKRLLSTKEGTNEANTCIICGKQCEDNPIFCNQCNDMLLNNGKEQGIENQGKVPVQASLNASDKIPEGITDNANKTHIAETNRSNAITAENGKNEPRTSATNGKGLKKKGIWKPVGIIILGTLLFFYALGRMTELEDNIDSATDFDNNYSQMEQDNVPELTGKVADSNTEDTLVSSQQDKESVKTELENNMEDTMEDVKESMDVDGDSFSFTEEELMGRIQEALAPYQLDIGTKKGYSNIYFVIQGDEASNVAYQIALNEASKVQTISINISSPVETLEVFGRAAAAAILICDPTITEEEANSVIDKTGSSEFITINDIRYVAGPLSEDVLSFFITKADIPEEVKSNSSEEYNNSEIVNENSTEDNKAENEIYDLSSLLGMTAKEVQSTLGDPIDSADNTEYYSDVLNIIYENGVAYKIILGLEDRFDFTQIEIPQTIYSVDGIYLGDAKETVLAKEKDAKLFTLDGVFYGNTYQIEQDGYYVNVDFYTLEDNNQCPVYRIVMTRLLTVN